MEQIRRIGVLTGGGDCPGLNAVIRAVVKTAINDYGWEVIGIEDGFEGLILPDKTRELHINDVRGILPQGGTILGTTNRANPFAYVTRKKDGRIVTRDVSGEVVQRIHELHLDALIVIGGDGSLKIGYEFYQKGVPIVGIPKTIDNDISCTDVTFGFDTALDTATQAIDKLHTTAESHHRIMIVEVMGRDAGWLALEAGLAGGADVILIPEIPFDLYKVDEKIERRDREGRRFSIIVVAEGTRPAGGEQVYQSSKDPTAPRRLGGIGQWAAGELSKMCDHEIRVTVLGHVQRGGSPSSFDRILGTRFGSAAARLVAEGRFGEMVSLRGECIGAVSLADAVSQLKTVPLDSDLIRTALSLGICLG
ncbi:MAG: 6-phosphofructokinase [Anaerolineae bacterium]|jgi:6-phosphofructokinase 1|nr:6-phosphofructokinase [Anaerolineae bacterium]MDH7475395.1 6-phosphofructokinase [Anaerolineae bacterium]